MGRPLGPVRTSARVTSLSCPAPHAAPDTSPSTRRADVRQRRYGMDTGMDTRNIDTPCYVCDEARLTRNLERIDILQKRTGCVVLLALKAFAMFSAFPLMRRHIAGTAASSLNEARLGSEEFGGQVHLCSPAYRDDEFDSLLDLCDHVVFNSFSQWRHFRPRVQAYAGDVRCGIRVNPEHSEVDTAIYDPCAPHSRRPLPTGAPGS